MATAKDYAEMSESEKKKEDWMNSKWRPMMGWLYMATCTFDFIIFPMIFAILQTMVKGQIIQWQPLTLQGAGLYHIAMGAVLGLTAWGRTQEKLNGVNNGRLAPVSQSVTTTFGTPSPGGLDPTSSFSASALNSFGGRGLGSTANQGFAQQSAGNSSTAAGVFSNTLPVAATGLGAAAAMAVPFTSNEILAGPYGKLMPKQPPEPEL
jgi:hypothetical protein